MVYELEAYPYAISFGKIIVEGLLIGDRIYIPAVELSAFVFSCVAFGIVLFHLGQLLVYLFEHFFPWLIRLICERKSRNAF